MTCFSTQCSASSSAVASATALFYGWDLISDPLYLFKITQGGMSFHGGLAGVMIAMWLYGRKLGVRIWR